MEVNELVKEAHRIAKDKGWWEPGNERTFGDIVALMHSELSEALEEFRHGKSMVYEKDGKPEGIAVELADCIIRIADFCGRNKVDLDGVLTMKMKYNESRPYRHGNKEI